MYFLKSCVITINSNITLNGSNAIGGLVDGLFPVMFYDEQRRNLLSDHEQKHYKQVR